MQLFHYNSEYPDYETASNNTDGLAAVSFFYDISVLYNFDIDPLLTNIGALEKKVLNTSLVENEYEVSLADHTSYLSFFLHGQNFCRIKFTLKKTRKLRQNTQ